MIITRNNKATISLTEIFINIDSNLNRFNVSFTKKNLFFQNWPEFILCFLYFKNNPSVLDTQEFYMQKIVMRMKKHQMRKQMHRLMHSCQYVVNKILLLTYDSQCATWYRKVSVDHVMNGSQ